MKTRLPQSRFIRLSVRWNIAILICAVAVGAIALRSYAQKRTAIRVSPGASSQPAPRKSARERERERERLRNRQAGGSLSVASQDLPYTPVSATSETVGTPSFGSVGIEKTTAQLMEDQKEAPQVDHQMRLAPEREYPDRRGLPQSPTALPIASFPVDTVPEPVKKPTKGRISSTIVKPDSATRTVATSAPQTVSTPNFTAATLADTGAFPPDTMGAVGPSQFFLFLNGRVRTFNKTTGVADGVLNVDSDVFFASVMTPLTGGVTLNFTSDPQIRYDRLTRRWILCIIDVPSTSVSTVGDRPNRALIAVSDAASNGVVSGGTVWTFYFIQQDTVGPIASTGEFLDYESLGVDEDALYIGGNMFGAVSGSFIGCSVFVVQKSSVLSGGPIVTTAFRGVVVGASDGPFSPRGVDNYAAGSNEGYFIGVSNTNFGRLNLRRISNPGGVPTISADIPFNTPSTTTFPENAQHLGNTGSTAGRLDALDDRLFAAHIRNGRLWTAHNIEVNATGVASSIGNRDAIRWYEVVVPPGAGTPTFNQTGTIFDPTVTNPRYYWIGTVGISGQGHAAFGFSSAGLADRVNAATNGRLRTDTLGTTGAVALYTGSSTAYNPPSDPGPGRRWGDYSFVSLDPKDDMTMWVAQEFCNATNTYGVQVVKVLAPPPATPASASVTTLSSGVPSTNITITGTSVSGSEFYDPGTDIPGAEPFTHISASVSGGVTVNSVTYTDPTHVIINVSTVGATIGSKDVTITNPDGQSMTGVGLFAVGSSATSSQLLISEFRLRGPSGANDEFVEIFNNTGVAHTVADSGAGAGYGLAASDGVLRCTIANGTVIPAGGHFLCTNSVAYSLTANATGNATYAVDIPDNAGIALFNTTVGANFILANRIDAVGSSSEANTLYKRGTGYPALTPFSIDYAFVRDECGKGGSITTFGVCPSGGSFVDTGNNATDFYFVDTNGTSAGAGQRLGAPGPQNLASPIQRNATFSVPLLDSTVSAAAPPNRVRDFTSDPANNSTFGTLDIRRRIVNNTGASVTRLRFRVIDITTFPAPSGIADLRTRTSTLVVAAGVNDTGTCGVAPTPCAVNIEGTTLEQPPSQPNGGAFNSTYSAGTITLGTPLANGASINVRFLMGIQQTGTFKFFINIEALP